MGLAFGVLLVLLCGGVSAVLIDSVARQGFRRTMLVVAVLLAVLFGLLIGVFSWGSIGVSNTGSAIVGVIWGVLMFVWYLVQAREDV